MRESPALPCHVCCCTHLSPSQSSDSTKQHRGSCISSVSGTVKTGQTACGLMQEARTTVASFPFFPDPPALCSAIAAECTGAPLIAQEQAALISGTPWPARCVSLYGSKSCSLQISGEGHRAGQAQSVFGADQAMACQPWHSDHLAELPGMPGMPGPSRCQPCACHAAAPLQADCAGCLSPRCTKSELCTLGSAASRQPQPVQGAFSCCETQPCPSSSLDCPVSMVRSHTRAQETFRVL